LLDEGEYLARCTDATIAWSRRWKKWISRLVMEPLDYGGRSFTGSLCKFVSLGTDAKRPRAGPNSDFQRLWVETNGSQPINGEVSLEIFRGQLFQITVRTVREKSDNQHTPIPPEQWYSVIGDVSFCKAGTRTREHQQHAIANNPGNTDNTRNTSNPLTLTQTQQHHNTTTHPCPSSMGREDPDWSLGEKQQTYNVHPDDDGADATTVNSAPHAQRCHIHGMKTSWWLRGEDWLCELCHPDPRK
jgi:hypothetical protein